MNAFYRISLTGIAATALIGALPSTADAQISKAGNKYTFRQKFTKGETTTLITNILTKGAPGAGPQGMKIGMTVSQTVVSTSGKQAEIDMKVGAPTINGKASGQAGSQTMRVTMDDHGKVIKGTSGAAPNFAAFPEKAIKVGDTWTSQMPMAQLGGATVTANYKFIGVKTIGGKRIAQIGVTVSATGQISVSGSGTSSFRLSDGSLESSAISMYMTMTSPQAKAPMKMNLEMSISRG